MTEFEKGYEQGYKDGMAGAALPNVNDNGDKIDGYSYAYKTDSNGEPYIHIDSVRSMLKKADDVQPVKRGRWIISNLYAQCSECSVAYDLDTFQRLIPMNENVPRHCSYCGARMEEGQDD